MARKLNQRGVVLLEVLLSALILSVGLIAIFRPLLGAWDALRYASTRRDADRVLMDQIWQFQDLVTRTKKIDINSHSEAVVSNGKQYVFERQVKPLLSTKDVFEADYRVSWMIGSRKLKTLMRSTYILIPYDKKKL